MSVYGRKTEVGGGVGGRILAKPWITAWWPLAVKVATSPTSCQTDQKYSGQVKGFPCSLSTCKGFYAWRLQTQPAWGLRPFGVHLGPGPVPYLGKPLLCTAVTFPENANKTMLTLKILWNVHSVKLWVQNSQNAIRYPPGSFLMSMLSPVSLSATPRTVAHQAPLSLGFSRHGYCSGLPCPSPGGHLPDPSIEPGSSALTGRSITVSATREAPSSIWRAFKLLWRGHLSLHFTCALL